MESCEELCWPHPPTDWTLHEGEIHVWAAALDVTSPAQERLGAALAATERERAARFHFERERNRYTVGRGLLRAILGRYLRTEPGELQLEYGPQGKPVLMEERSKVFVDGVGRREGSRSDFAFFKNENENE